MTVLKYYKIHYEVDNGASYCKDAAIVVAEDEYGAVGKLKRYISSLSSEHVVSEIFSVEEFTDDIFSYQYTPREKGRFR